MELDDFKNTVLPDKEPYENVNTQKENKMDMFIEELKAADAKDRKNTRMFIIVMGVFVVIYSSTLVRIHETMKDGYAMLVLGFALTLFYLFWRYRKLSAIDYSAPSIQFLREAGQRHRFMRPVDWIVTIPMLILFFAGGCSIIDATFTKYFGPSAWPLGIYSVVMAAAAVIGFWSSMKIWKRDKKGILEKIRKMQAEFGD
jgi:hypothetical protein